MAIFATKRFIKWTIIILVILNLTTLTMLWIKNNNKDSYKKPRLPVRGPKESRQFLTRELSLSEEQDRLFKELRHGHRFQGKKIQHQIHKLKREIMEGLFDPDFDNSKLNHLISEIGKKHGELELLTFNHFRELKNVLNTSQRNKFLLLVHDLLRMIEAAGKPGSGPPPPKHQGPPKGRD